MIGCLDTGISIVDYFCLYNNQINASALIGHLTMVYGARKPITNYYHLEI